MMARASRAIALIGAGLASNCTEVDSGGGTTVIVEHGRVSWLRRGEVLVTVPGYELAWRGVPWYPGERPGIASISAVLGAGGADALLSAARLLRGNYVLSLRETGSGRHVVFTDPGGMFDAFVTGSRIGTSFLQLAEAAGATFADVDAAAAVELLDLGFVFHGRTLLDSVRRLVPGNLYELRAGAEPLAHDLGVPRIDVPWRGKPLISHEVVVNLIAATTTRTGLKVRSALDSSTYPAGQKVGDAEMETLYLRPEASHGEWNYSLLPRQRLLPTELTIS